MRCRSALTRIDALRTGELPDDEQRAVDEHLRTCPSCEESLDDVGDLARGAKALIAVPPKSCKSEVEKSVSDCFDEIEDDGTTVWVVFSERGVRMLHRGGSEDELRERHEKRFDRLLRRSALPETLRDQVVKAIHGEQVRNPRLDWSDKDGELERKVLETLMRIPHGQVRTYEWVARQVGRPRAMRAVGNVCAKNVIPFLIPCHRVVPTGGGVGNYAFGSALKRDLLRREGVDVDGLDALARDGVRYIGSRTTKIVCFPTCGDAMRIRDDNRVPFRAVSEAEEKGFRPCLKCQPFAA